MPETATKTSTPRRTSAARKPAAKAATAKPAPAPAVEETEDERARVAFTLVPGDETKRYQKFDLAFDKEGNATGCAGTVYAPLGTEVVRIQLVGPASAVEPE
jgi:hypothetical protein